jgi:hypothetical protein
MGILAAEGVIKAYHYTPLHYLPFIVRSKSILRKTSLKKAGFNSAHFRSMSKKRDVARGFGDYVHLTLDLERPILQAKLAAGFPHIALGVPIENIEATAFSLCRFNVAMTRKLRREKMPGSSESITNGRYYTGHQIPIARTDEDKTAMLKLHLPAGTMIEVLAHDDVKLPDSAAVICFSDADAEIASNLLAALKCNWTVETSPPSGTYPRDAKYVESILAFIERAHADESWRGNGLEFDRLPTKPLPCERTRAPE